MTEAWLPADHGSDPERLRPRVSRGLAWTVIDLWGSQAINLAAFVILTRLLLPDQFGLVALAAVFVAFAQLVVDQGLGDALIQRAKVTRSHIDTAFWAAMATGALLTVAGVTLAAPIAALLDEPELAPILQVMSLTFVLAAMSSIQIALLRRELAFKRLAVRALVAAAAGGLVSVPMALAGAGAWALVGQQVTSAIVSVVTLWRVSPWRPRFHASRAEFRELFGFGANVVGSDALNFLGRNADNMLIGVFLGTTALGFYAVGYRILEVTQRILVNVARRIAFPAFARLQHDRDRMRRAYFRLTRATSAVILPGYVGLALVAPELTTTLFGARWAESGPVAAMLFLIGPVLTVQAFSGSLLNAAGHPEVVFRFRLITSVTNIVGFAIAVSYGILAVAAAYVVRGYLLLPLILVWMRRYADIPIADYLRQMHGTAAATFLMAAAVLGIKLAASSVAPGLLLVLEIVGGSVVYLAALWIVQRAVIHEVVEVVRDAASGLRGRRASASVAASTESASVGLDDA